ncbi:Anthranilate phosphoribosyltransferase [Methyloligella halotolerans]|uniref:Anthranilate phosphoribosyltransferase n=1 Tax=Methyloligella halotolerans TaxID=1177755 RepID=A0A1E2S207_9HYPH|nr:anthranilate phosphoribosyltransferase [Methyloligella halotolerans]ODA68474.1 Anthranilate phosphoribosyltransferase [Methyloligella halotolerans]
MADLRDAIAKVVSGKELSEREATEAFELVMAGDATPGQLGALLVALKMRGEAVDEITGAAKVLRAKVRKVEAPEGAIDTCGTGGDSKGTHNISTCAAFVVAGAGLPVAKHGNRSISSRSGSADVLTALDVNIDLEPEQVTRCIREAGLGFMFAPAHHSAMRHVAPVRRELGTRTIFNLLGPLANPANTKFQLIGVYGKEWVEPLAHVLGRLGVKRAWVVHGADGLDELTTTTISHVAALDQGRISTFNVSPKNAGLREAKPQDLLGGDATANAAHIRAVLEGMEGPFRDIVLFNAGAALMIGGKAKSLRDGVALAADSIDSGRAKDVLAKLVEISRESAEGAA